jgi:hypothetical protein
VRNKSMVIVCVLVAASTTYPARAMKAFGGWAQAVSIELAPPGANPAFNTQWNDGCPSASRDGLSLYLASNRPGSMVGVNGLPSQDIWVSRRASVDEPWGEPTNVGEAINTPYDDFCPSPMRDGHGFLFVSTRPGSCGGADIYITREHVKRGWAEPVNLGCQINSSAGEASPFFIEYDDGTAELYFSSTRPGGPGEGADSDIYLSALRPDGSLGASVLVPGLNTHRDDSRPNLRRDGLEIFFDSTRPGGSGGADIWTSTRSSASDPWSTPQNLGGAVNTEANETRPWLSWDATTLYFGSNRLGSEGMADWYVTTRSR